MELKNRFDRAQSELRFEGQHYKGGRFIALSGGQMWEAVAEPRNPATHEPIAVRAASREALVRKLAEGLPGFKLYRTGADDVGEELQQIKTERAQQLAREKAAAVEAAKPKLKLFGLDADSAEAQQIAQREAAAWIQSHAGDPNFIVSPFNQKNLTRLMDDLMGRDEVSNPTAEAYEKCYQFLLANGFWEPATRMRGQPAAMPYRPQPVAPQPTQEEITEKERTEALAERKRLEAMPLDQLRELAETERKNRLRAREEARQQQNEKGN